MNPESIVAVYARGRVFTRTEVTPPTANPGGMVTRARSTPVLVPDTNVWIEYVKSVLDPEAALFGVISARAESTAAGAPAGVVWIVSRGKRLGVAPSLARNVRLRFAPALSFEILRMTPRFEDAFACQPSTSFVISHEYQAPVAAGTTRVPATLVSKSPPWAVQATMPFAEIQVAPSSPTVPSPLPSVHARLSA